MTESIYALNARQAKARLAAATAAVENAKAKPFDLDAIFVDDDHTDRGGVR